MFISQTRLRRVSPQTDAALYPGIVTDKAAKLTELGIAPANWGNFVLVYDIKAYLRVRALGVVDAGTRTHLVVMLFACVDAATRDAGRFDVAESFVFARPRATMDVRQYLRGAFRDFLERASLQGLSGDYRDRRLNPRTNDGTGFFDDPEVVALRNADLDIDTAVN